MMKKMKRSHKWGKREDEQEQQRRRRGNKPVAATNGHAVGMQAAASLLEVRAAADPAHDDDDDGGGGGAHVATASTSGRTGDAGDAWLRLGIDERFASHLSSLKYTSPLPVQLRCIPAVLGGRDVILSAQTGAGKTLAYAVPALQQLRRMSMNGGVKLRRDDGCRVLCLSPTRELCIQILSVFGALCRPMPWCVAGAVIGGEKRSSEKARLRKGVVVLVASPGRLLDHLNKTEAFTVDALSLLVLDEVDRLLDLDQWRTVEELVRVIDERRKAKQGVGRPSHRQTIACSATISDNVRGAIISVFRAPDGHIDVDVGANGGHGTGKERNVEEVEEEKEEGGGHQPGDGNGAMVHGSAIPETLTLEYMSVESKDRLPVLLGFLKHVLRQPSADADTSPKVVVFVSSRACTEFLSAVLGTNLECRVARLHGDLAQGTRISLFVEFVKSAEAAVLLSTDVAARGLDIPGVSTIIQYDPPSSVDEFLHRAGRTARNGTHMAPSSFCHTR